MADNQTPSPDPAKKYWWAAGIVVPILVALIGLMAHKQQDVPVAPPDAAHSASGDTLIWCLPIIGFVLVAGIVSVIVALMEDDLPTPVLVLFAIFGAAFATWAAASTTPHEGPLLVMILLAVSGISMLAYGIACHSRGLRLGTYVGCCAAVVAAVFLVIWETGSRGPWVTPVDRISDAPDVFHIWYAVLVTLGVIISAWNALAWISLALAGLSIVYTVALDLSDSRPEEEAIAVGLGVFLVAVIMVHFALRGEDVDDLPDWVLSCLVLLRRFGGLALIGLGILGLATTERARGYNGAALGVGLLALLTAASTSPFPRRRRF